MANCYTDHPELRFELNHPLMKRIVELKERNFRDKESFDYAPLDHEDAMDSYDRVLDIVGEITGTTIADNAEGVDLEGPHHEGDRVRYASGTAQNLDAMVKAPPLQWSQLPHHALHDVRRNRGCQGRWLRQYLEPPRLH